MSNEIKVFKEYIINENGSCIRCSGLIKYGVFIYCKAFDQDLKYEDIHIQQCKDCIEYLEKEKSKVYCNDCMLENDFYRCHETGGGCYLGNKTQSDWYYWYCENCRDKKVNIP